MVADYYNLMVDDYLFDEPNYSELYVNYPLIIKKNLKEGKLNQVDPCIVAKKIMKEIKEQELIKAN